MGDSIENSLELSWLQRVMTEECQLSKEIVVQLIMNYFIVQGYPEVAKVFKEEAGILVKNDNIDVYLTKERSRIKDAIINNQSKNALELIEALNLPPLTQNEDLKYIINQACFIDLVRKNRCEEALAFAQTHLYTLKLENDEEKRKDIEEFMMLLLCEDSSKSNSPLLEPKFKQSTARIVNEIIINKVCHGLSPEPKLNRLLDTIREFEDKFDKQSIPYLPLLAYLAATASNIPL